MLRHNPADMIALDKHKYTDLKADALPLLTSREQSVNSSTAPSQAMTPSYVGSVSLPRTARKHGAGGAVHGSQISTPASA